MARALAQPDPVALTRAPCPLRLSPWLMRCIIIGLMAAANTPLAAAELMVCYAAPESQSLGPIFLQEPLRCAAAHKAEERGTFVDMPRGLAELYENGWRLIQVLERKDGQGTQYLAYVERR
jgi:hypothetical protein